MDATSSPSSLLALVVDDDTNLTRVLQRELRLGGYEVETASSVAKALELLDRLYFDLAIVDLNLQDGRTGQDVLARLAVDQPACTRVLTSGDLRLDSALEAVNRGRVSRLLPKPFRRQDLLEIFDTAANERRRLFPKVCSEAMFHECIQNHVELALQPIVDAATGAVRAREALLRSTHDRLTGPIEILMAAGDYGLYGALGARVMSLAAEVITTMAEDELLFVNIHPMELACAKSFARQLHPLLPHASRVVLEITEHQSLSAAGDWDRTLYQARELGFRIAIDDLGAGHSTLSALAEVDPEFLKIDRSLVQNIHTSRVKQRLVGVLEKFARISGATLITEGVECESEANTLIDLGAHWLQGYHVGRPVLA